MGGTGVLIVLVQCVGGMAVIVYACNPGVAPFFSGYISFIGVCSNHLRWVEVCIDR